MIDLSNLQATNMSPDFKGRERSTSNEIKQFKNFGQFDT